ncbi:MAG: hypothetical protein ACK5PQ_01110 [Alphaproteobacteria bacterium]
MKKTLDQISLVKSKIKNGKLILGVHPYEAHPLLEETPNDVFFLNDDIPQLALPKMSYLEERFFHLNFNSEDFKDSFSIEAQGIFSRVYFDWSTFKFAGPNCIEGLHRLLPIGGKIIIPEPINMIHEILQNKETSADFWKLSHEERYQRNLQAKIIMLRKSGFTVKMIKSSDIHDDPVFDKIRQHFYQQEGKEKIFNVLIATKNPSVLKTRTNAAAIK